MAKDKRSKKVKVKRKGKKVVMRMGPTRYQSLLLDPCNGPLHSPYAGPAGFVQRFSLDTARNTGAGSTAGFLIFAPSREVFNTGDSTSSNAAGTAGLVNGLGQSYLNTLAADVRTVAACVTIIPSAVSANNVTGEIGVAVMPYGKFNGVASFVPDNLIQLCPSRGIISKRTYDVKWFAGTNDHEYGNQVTAGGVIPAAGNAGSGDNCILVVWRGFPATTPLNFRLTSVLEWTPTLGLGVTTPAQAKAPEDHQAQAAALSDVHSSWWSGVASGVGGAASEFVQGVASDVGKVGRYLTRKGLASAVQYIERGAVAAGEAAIVAL